MLDILDLLPWLQKYEQTIIFFSAQLPPALLVVISWVLQLWKASIVLPVAVTLAAFLVYRDVVRELDEMRTRLAATEAARPKLDVGFRDDSGKVTKRLVLPLTNVTWPDYARFVDQKRDELYGLRSQPLSMGLEAFGSIFERPNPNYEAEVEEYLDSYKEYKIFATEHLHDRIREFQPVVKNTGNVSIHRLVLKIAIPEGSAFLSPRQADLYYWTYMEGKLPREPHPPKPIISGFDTTRLSLPRLDRELGPEPPIVGPDYEESESGRLTVTYKIEEIVPHDVIEALDPFTLRLVEVNPPAVWEFKVVGKGRELREPIEDTIFVQFDVADTSEPDQEF